MSDRPDGQGLNYGLLMAAEWAAREGNDKDFICAAGNLGVGNSVTDTYVVPAGKTLYINEYSFSCEATGPADRDLNQIVTMRIRNSTTGVDAVFTGGNGGGGGSLPKPVEFTAGQTMTLQCYNSANHSCHVVATCHGYEV